MIVYHYYLQANENKLLFKTEKKHDVIQHIYTFKPASVSTIVQRFSYLTVLIQTELSHSGNREGKRFDLESAVGTGYYGSEK